MADSQIEHVRRSTQAEVPQKMIDIGGGLYAALVAISGSVTVVDGGASLTVDGPLTNSELRATAVPTSDAGASWLQSYTTTTSADMTGAADLTAAPTAGQKIVIDDVLLSSNTALYIDLLEETTSTLIARVYLPAGGTAQFTPRGKLKLPSADKKLRGDASLAGNVAITVLYHSEA